MEKEVYFQDPTLNNFDVSFLQSLGYSVLDRNRAFAKMSYETFLFAPCVSGGNLDTVHLCIQSQSPSLYIGKSLDLRRHEDDRVAEV